MEVCYSRLFDRRTSPVRQSQLHVCTSLISWLIANTKFFIFSPYFFILIQSSKLILSSFTVSYLVSFPRMSCIGFTSKIIDKTMPCDDVDLVSVRGFCNSLLLK